jgi:hypothetical protein
MFSLLEGKICLVEDIQTPGGAGGLLGGESQQRGERHNASATTTWFSRSFSVIPRPANQQESSTIFILIDLSPITLNEESNQP